MLFRSKQYNNVYSSIGIHPPWSRTRIKYIDKLSFDFSSNIFFNDINNLITLSQSPNSCDDFFNIDGNFDLIIEQTFFCAIATEKRNEYAKKVHSLLNTNGKLVGLMFNAPMYSEHPPFGGSVKEYKSYFSGLFNYKYFEPAYNSISLKTMFFSRKGNKQIIIFKIFFKRIG